jgi:hypothetical protein
MGYCIRNVKLFGALCMLFAFLNMASAQQALRVADLSATSGTIVISHSGRSSIPLDIYIDDKLITRLSLHKRVTFWVAPGYHEVSVKFKSFKPVAPFHVLSGQKLYFSVEFDAPWIGMVDSSALTIGPVNSVLDPKTKEEAISEDHLAFLRYRANPTGADPKP